MPSIADTYVTIFPETSKIAAGIKSAFRSVDDDAREAGRRWGREIQEGMGETKVKLDADTSKVRAEIDKAAKDQKSTVEVSADTAKANAQIAEAAHDRHATVHLDVNKSQTSEVASDLGGDVSKAMSSGMQSGGTAGIGALNPALLGVGITMAAGIVSALSGLAGLLPAGLLGAGGVVGTLAVGLDGVKEAWDAAGKAAQSSGKDQASQAKAVTAAQKDLRGAVRDEARAQQDVATARKDALRQLQGLNSELRHGALDEAQAQLNLQKDQQELLTGTFQTPVDYQQAQLNVLKDQQDVQDAHQRSIDVQDKANTVRQQGVEGNPAVVAAEDRFAASIDRVAEAQQKMIDAFKPSTEMQAAIDAMAKLSPNAQQFITTLQGMKPAFDQFKNSIQDALFANIGPQFQQLAQTYLPLLQGFMSQMATTMNQAFGSLAKFLEQPQTLAAMQQIFANIGSSFQVWTQALQPFSEAFLKITQVGSTFLPQLAQMVVQVAQAFNQWAQSGQLGEWIQTGLTALQQLGGLVQQLLPIFAQLAPIGIATMSGLQTVFAALGPSIAPLSQAFASLITAITPALGFIGQIVTTVITALVPVLTQWANALGPVIQQIAGVLQPVLQQLQPILGQVAAALANGIATGVRTVLPVLIPFVEQVGKLLVAVLPLLPSLTQLVVSIIPVMQQVVAASLPGMTKMVELLTNLANIVIPPLSKAITLLSGTASLQFKGLKDAVTTMWDVAKPILEAMKTLVEAIAGPLERIGNFFDPNGAALDKLNAARAAHGLPPVGPDGQAPVGGATIPRTTVTSPGVTAPNGITPIGPPFTGLPGLPGLTPSATGGVGGGATGGLHSGFNWDAVAQPESGGNWSNADTGNNGHYGGLQFSPSTWAAFGGLEFAPRPDLATPDQQKIVADRTAFSGYNGTPPQGLGAWETITKGMVPGVTVNTPGQAAPAPLVGPGGPGTSPNGFPLLAPEQSFSVNGVSAQDAAGAPAQRLQAFAQWFNDNIEPVKELAGFDAGGHGLGNKSNHTSGTALDINWSDFTALQGNGADARTHFTPEQIQAISQQLTQTGMTWGQYWTPDSRDPGHFELGGAAYDKGAKNTSGATGQPNGQPTNPLYVALSPNIPANQQAKGKGDNSGEQLGQDFLGGIGEIFGLDGSVFKDPTQFGLFKIFKAFMGLKLKDNKGAQGGGGASLLPGGGGGGGGIMDALSSFIPKPFGDLKIGSPQDAPGQFMPSGPGGSGGSGAMPTLPNPFAAPNDPSRVAGPGNGPPVVNNFDMSGSNYGTTPQGVQDHIQQAQLPAIRTYAGPR